MVNGEPRGFIQQSRGLRQGNPLSPYLFLLFIEGLVSLLNDLVANNSLIGLKVCRGAPNIKHLLFVDDSLIFCKTEKDSSLKLLEILRKYELSLVKCINTAKTTMVFNRNVPYNEQVEIRAFWDSNQ